MVYFKPLSPMCHLMILAQTPTPFRCDVTNYFLHLEGLKLVRNIFKNCKKCHVTFMKTPHSPFSYLMTFSLPPPLHHPIVTYYLNGTFLQTWPFSIQFSARCLKRNTSMEIQLYLWKSNRSFTKFWLSWVDNWK